MNRRGFLGLIASTAGATAAGLAIPELWTPKRTFFLPPRGGWQIERVQDPYDALVDSYGNPVCDQSGNQLWVVRWPEQIIGTAAQNGYFRPSTPEQAQRFAARRFA